MSLPDTWILLFNAVTSAPIAVMLDPIDAMLDDTTPMLVSRDVTLALIALTSEFNPLMSDASPDTPVTRPATT